jgi:carbonic anhydrase/acetyltransferase-like protein (isoleucine patch superfamily)
MSLIQPFGNLVPQIAADAFIAANATVIGDVTIGAQSSIWFGCVVRGDSNRIRIGERTNIQDGTVIHVNAERDGGRGAVGWCTTIGSDITVGHLALLHACILEDGAFVGMRACVMDGCVVEGQGMVAAGALLTPGKRVRKGELWGGSPAKLMRQLSAAEFEYLAYSARHYIELAAAYRRQGG